MKKVDEINEKPIKQVAGLREGVAMTWPRSPETD